MSVPVWVSANHLGSVTYADFFEKNLVATDAVSYSVQSGSLPQGVTLSSNGLLSGTPVIEDPAPNTVIFVYTFTVRATSLTSQTDDRDFSLSVIFGDLYIPSNLEQVGVRYSADYYQYQIFRGTVDTANNVYWRLETGQLPPSANISQQGIVSGQMTGVSSVARPLIRESFLTSTQLTQGGSLSQESWNSWLGNLLNQGLEYDYQFGIMLSDGMGPVQLSLTVRIVYTKIPADNNSWFVTNNISYNPDNYYFFIGVSDNDYIVWDSDSDLGNINNGAVSDLAVLAHSYSQKPIQYAIKPFYTSNLPRHLVLFSNGLLAGRVSFRTYQDDPTIFPVNDNYAFTVRAYTLDGFTYGEKTFSLHVNRLHDQPYDNLWARAFSSLSERSRLQEILNDPILFPNELIYRSTDPWFGRAEHLKFLVVPGLQSASSQDYYAAMTSNHYRKEITFDTVKTAVAYDNNLKIKYEVVYLPVLDNLTGTDPVTKQPAGLPNVIDLRDQIENYYLENDKAYYIFKPNGLINMRSQIENAIGVYRIGVLPSWMTSLQPIPGKPGQFYAPTGFVNAVVLAYTVPGGSDLIAFRLRQAQINFNDLRFEFDRYEFDSIMTTEWSNLATSLETIFDGGLSIFENNGTKFIEQSGTTPIEGQGADSGDKYLKFPNFGVFN